MSSRPHPTAPRLRTRLATPVFAALFVALASAQTTGFPPEQLEFFEKNVRPVLADHCFECHSGAKAKAGLRLDSRQNVLKGSEFRLVVDPQKPEASVLLLAVKHAGGDKVPAMPHEKPKLPDPAVAALEQWLKMGAPWPEDAGGLSGDDPARSHWAYQPVKAEAVPADFRGNPIDWFVGEKLREAGLESAPAADRETLVRRAHLDLTGLPPTADEARAFVTDPRPDAEAWPALVDKLLASPHYGERWARHWLDIAHYADTHGFERDKLRPDAWRYRDYVIDSLNADKPYDQFLREQIAGDVIAPNDPQCVIATGFLAAGPWDFVGQVETKSDMLKRAARALDLDDMVTQTITATMGITINCARCHDHKLDPITQEEYYRLWAVFAGVKRGERDADPRESQRIASEKERLTKELTQTRAQIAKLAGEGLDLADIVGGGDGRGTGVKGRGIHI
ncbi:MAG: DUF1549 domain-containing protein, partial [Verrucomicrobiae bacterium]|nr:DUF1549 domain-containing protein [Verrucomicrobiae bacterium]